MYLHESSSKAVTHLKTKREKKGKRGKREALHSHLSPPPFNINTKEANVPAGEQ